jgi:hypothetical protein
MDKYEISRDLTGNERQFGDNAQAPQLQKEGGGGKHSAKKESRECMNATIG